MRNHLKVLDQKVLVSLLAFGLALLGVAIVNPDNSGISTVQSYPATVCPPKLSDATSTSVLPSSKILVRQIPNKKNKLAKAKTSYYLSNSPLLVDGNSESSINVTRSKSRALATVVCSISSGDQWFVGGSGSVTSRASVVIINSGLSTSVVDFFIYSSNTVSSVISKRIAKNSSKRIYLDTLAPGEDSVVIHAITRSGRVTTYLHDQRQRGLVSLGADFVSHGAQPANRVVIPAISNVRLSGKNTNQSLRILAPGNVAANVRAKIVATDGSFAPIGLDDINIPAGKVKDITFKPVLNTRTFSLVLTADRPIVAAVKSSGNFNGTNEFAWAGSSFELSNLTLYFGGLAPEVVFAGKDFEVDVTWTDKNKKVQSKTLRGSEIAIWRPSKGITKASFSTANKQVYGAVIFKEKSGLSQFPLVAGAQLESAAVPNANARVITRE